MNTCETANLFYRTILGNKFWTFLRQEISIKIKVYNLFHSISFENLKSATYRV